MDIVFFCVGIKHPAPGILNPVFLVVGEKICGEGGHGRTRTGDGRIPELGSLIPFSRFYRFNNRNFKTLIRVD